MLGGVRQRRENLLARTRRAFVKRDAQVHRQILLGPKARKQAGLQQRALSKSRQSAQHGEPFAADEREQLLRLRVAPTKEHRVLFVELLEPRPGILAVESREMFTDDRAHAPPRSVSRYWRYSS